MYRSFLFLNFSRVQLNAKKFLATNSFFLRTIINCCHNNEISIFFSSSNIRTYRKLSNINDVRIEISCQIIYNSLVLRKQSGSLCDYVLHAKIESTYRRNCGENDSGRVPFSNNLISWPSPIFQDTIKVAVPKNSTQKQLQILQNKIEKVNCLQQLFIVTIQSGGKPHANKFYKTILI